MTNRILAFGINAIVAQVYKSESWFDGKECIVLDYSKTSLLAEHVRDEIRQIGPGLYLGLVYWKKDTTVHFRTSVSNFIKVEELVLSVQGCVFDLKSRSTNS